MSTIEYSPTLANSFRNAPEAAVNIFDWVRQRGRRIGSLALAGGIAMGLAACDEGEAFAHDVALKKGDGVYNAPSSKTPCGYMASNRTLEAERIFNGAAPANSIDGFDAAGITPLLKTGEQCAGQGTLWVHAKRTSTPQS